MREIESPTAIPLYILYSKPYSFGSMTKLTQITIYEEWHAKNVHVSCIYGVNPDQPMPSGPRGTFLLFCEIGSY